MLLQFVFDAQTRRKSNEKFTNEKKRLDKRQRVEVSYLAIANCIFFR